MDQEKLDKILKNHKLTRANLAEANLAGANLTRANLAEANLAEANLAGANLAGANLAGANLAWADLTGANLTGANLTGANLTEANLTEANLTEANLTRANLTRANLTRANLTRANLTRANLPNFQIPQSGWFYGWKKGDDGEIIQLKIPKWARRTGNLIGRKCRAEFAVVIDIKDKNNVSIKMAKSKNKHFKYEIGKIIAPDNYNPDIRIECTNGIHFFMTRKEAEEW